MQEQRDERKRKQMRFDLDRVVAAVKVCDIANHPIYKYHGHHCRKYQIAAAMLTLLRRNQKKLELWAQIVSP